MQFGVTDGIRLQRGSTPATLPSHRIGSLGCWQQRCLLSAFDRVCPSADGTPNLQTLILLAIKVW